ncbi:hypothetical protein [Glutamicibacter sp. V16R2B1]|uniref:hypothetical protein n=1 Tax=Glutamicibacter TaxID=1742989 RepID=UPI0020172FC0|nr:hypothetical protein [Glutamicibacter sp. V16R2B1]
MAQPRREENVMAERGNTKHGSNLDDQMKQETEGMVKGKQPDHVEAHRQTEPFPDDTDPQEVQDAVEPVAEQNARGDAQQQDEGQ